MNFRKQDDAIGFTARGSEMACVSKSIELENPDLTIKLFRINIDKFTFYDFMKSGR